MLWNLVLSMAAKRKLVFSDYDKIDKESMIASASIHGIVTHVSPVKVSKKGNNYFHGEVTDGRTSLRFVGFSAGQQRSSRTQKNQECTTWTGILIKRKYW